MPSARTAGMQLAGARGVARGARRHLREVLRDHAHATLDFRDPLLRDVERIAIAQRLVDRAITDREHDGRDEHRDHHFDEREAARGASAIRGLGCRRPWAACRECPECPACRCRRIAGPPGLLADCRSADCPRSARPRRRARSERALPTTPVTVVVQASLSVEAPLDVLGVSVCAVGFSTARESSTSSPVACARTSMRNIPLTGQLGDFLLPLPAHAAHHGVAGALALVGHLLGDADFGEAIERHPFGQRLVLEIDDVAGGGGDRAEQGADRHRDDGERDQHLEQREAALR